MSLTELRDKPVFEHFGRAVHGQLERQAHKGIRVRRRAPDALHTSSDGWHVSFGTLGKGVFLHARWDRFSGHSNRQLWYGVYSEVAQSIRDVTAAARADGGGGPVVHCGKDQSVLTHYWRLTVPLPVSSMGTDVMELFPHLRFPFFYGVYSKSCTTTTKLRSHAAVAEAVDYFNYLRRIVLQYKGAATEGWKRHVCLEKSARNQALAQRRKEHDSFTCQVCRMNYQKTYGSLGARFAECHHRVALAERSRPALTRLDDLITVCADCHRMLHRMPGERADYLELQAVMRRQRARSR